MTAAHNVTLAPAAGEAGAFVWPAYARGLLFCSWISAALVRDVNELIPSKHSQMDQAANRCDRTASCNYLGVVLSDRLV